MRSIHPHGFGVAQAGERTYPFFLEWERRSLNPSTLSARLAPYLRYHPSNRPLALVLFDEPLVDASFLGVARREMERTGVKAPLWMSYRKLLEKDGPLGAARRNPEVLGML